MAELTATLDAQIAPLARSLAAADALLAGARRQLKEVEHSAAEAGIALGRVKMDTRQAFDTEAVLKTMERSLSRTSRVATETAFHLNNVRLDARAAAETEANATIEVEALRRVERQARETRRAQRGSFLAAGGSGLAEQLGALIPGGTRASGYGLAAGITGLAALVAPLLPAVGVLAAIPGLVAPAAGALGVLALGFHDVGKAIDGNKKAYQELAPAQKAFVDQMRALYPLLNGMRQIAGENLFGPITSALKSFSENSAGMAQLGGIIAGMARTMGDLIGSWIRFLTSTDVLKQLNQVLAFGAGQLRVFSSAMQDVVRGLLNMAQTFQPLERFLASAIAQAAKWFETWSKSTQAAALNQTIIDSLKLLAQTVGSLLDLFGALYTVLAPIGKLLLDALNPAIRDLAGWLRANADTIQNVLIGALKTAGEAFRIVLSAVKTVGGALFDLLKILSGGDWKRVFEVVIAGGAAIMAIQFVRSTKIMQAAWTLMTSTVEAETVAAAAVIRGALITTGIGALIVAVGLLATYMLTHTKEVLDGIATMVNAVRDGIDAVINFVVQAVADFVNHFVTAYNAVFGWLTGNLKEWKPGYIKLWGDIGFQSAQAYAQALTAGVVQANGSVARSASGWYSLGTGVPVPAPNLPPGAMGRPGSGGQYAFPFASGNYQSQRVDMGKDFTTHQPVYSIGSGKVSVVRRYPQYSGWPGFGTRRQGGFVSVTLTEGARAGWTFFVAENITPTVSEGQMVGQGTVIAIAKGGLEMGWAAGPGSTDTLATKHGHNAIQLGKSSDPGGAESPEGIDFAGFLNAIRGGGTGGTTPPPGGFQTPGGFPPTPITPYGAAPPFTGAAARRTRKPSLLDQVFPPALQAEMSAALTRLTEAETAAQDKSLAHIRAEISAERSYIAELEKVKKHLDEEHATGKKLAELEKERALIAGKLKQEHKDLARMMLDQQHALVTAKDYRLLGLDPAGQQLSPGTRALRKEMAQIDHLMREGYLKISATTRHELAVLNEILKQKYIDPQVRQIVKQRLDEIRSTIKDALAAQAAAFKSAWQGVADAILAQFDETTAAHVDAMRTSMQNALDAFDQETQDTVQKMRDDLQRQLDNLKVMVHSAAGDFLFGGDITETPAEQALRQLQAIQATIDAAANVTVAAMELVRARAGGDPMQILQATLAMNRARVAQQEDTLSKEAAIQRKAADEQLALARKALQAQGDEAIKAYEHMRKIHRHHLQHMLEDQIKDYEEQRKQQRKHLVEQLAAFEKFALHHRRAYNKLFGPHGELLEIFKTFGISLTDLAGNLGDDFINALARALGLTPPGKKRSGAVKQPGVDTLSGTGMALGGVAPAMPGGDVYRLGEGGVDEAVIPMTPGWRGRMGGGVTYVDSRPIIVQVSGRTLLRILRKEALLLGKQNVDIWGGLG